MSHFAFPVGLFVFLPSSPPEEIEKPIAPLVLRGSPPRGVREKAAVVGQRSAKVMRREAREVIYE